MSPTLSFVVALQQAYLECLANIGTPKCLVLSPQAESLLIQWGEEMHPLKIAPVGIKTWNDIPVRFNTKKTGISFAFFT